MREFVFLFYVEKMMYTIFNLKQNSFFLGSYQWTNKVQVYQLQGLSHYDVHVCC